MISAEIGARHFYFPARFELIEMRKLYNICMQLCNTDELPSTTFGSTYNRLWFKTGWISIARLIYNDPKSPIE
jgi:hypothetical protein